MTNQGSYVLGISAFCRDSAAVLLRNGRPIAAAQEERSSRSVHLGLPAVAIQHCLTQAQIDMASVGVVACYDNARAQFRASLHGQRDFQAFKTWLPSWLNNELRLPEHTRRHLRYAGPTVMVDSLTAHAASVFLSSAYEDAAIIVADGVGWLGGIGWGRGSGHRTDLRHHSAFPHTLGTFLSAFVELLGLGAEYAEREISALARRGRPRFSDLIRPWLDIRDDGSLHLNARFFTSRNGAAAVSQRSERLLGVSSRRVDAACSQDHLDLAASIQHIVNEVLLKQARYVRRETSATRLCITGAIAGNLLRTETLQNAGIFEDVWYQPISEGAGGALGAALSVWHQASQHATRDALETSPRPQIVLGRALDQTAAKKYFDQMCCPYREYSDPELLVAAAARLLEQGKTVAWFQTSPEFGSLAPLSRVVLATDARALRTAMADAGAPEDSQTPCAMTVALMASHPAPHRGLGAVDIDEIQIVGRDSNDYFHRLLEAVRQRTGGPWLCAAPLGERGEPIAQSYLEAFQCFMIKNIDALVLGDLMLEKQLQPPMTLKKNHAPRKSAKVRYKVGIAGASVSYGSPYASWFDFGTLASKCLGGTLLSKPIEVVNLAQPATCAADTLRQLQTMPADTSAAIVYCGQNEFWAKYAIRTDGNSRSRRIFDSAVVDPAAKRRVLDEWEERIEQMVTTCAQRGVRLLLSTIGQNIGDRSPNRSILQYPRNAAWIARRLNEYSRLRQGNELPAAIDQLRQILVVEPTFALALKYLGDCLRLQGDTGSAVAAYEAAIEHDGFPSLAVPSQNVTIRKVASRHGVLLLDAEDALKRASRDGIPGYNVFVDEVHPNVKGYCHIAMELARTLKATTGALEPMGNLDETEVLRHHGFDDRAACQVHKAVSFEIFHWSRLTWEGASKERIEQAIQGHLAPAERSFPGDATVFFLRMLMEASRGNLVEARRCIQRAQARSPVSFQQRFLTPYIFEGPVLYRYLKLFNLIPLLREYGVLFPEPLRAKIPMTPRLRELLKTGLATLNLSILAVIYYAWLVPVGLLGQAIGALGSIRPPKGTTGWERRIGPSEEHASEGYAGHAIRFLLRLCRNGEWLLSVSSLAILCTGGVVRRLSR